MKRSVLISVIMLSLSLLTAVIFDIVTSKFDVNTASQSSSYSPANELSASPNGKALLSLHSLMSATPPRQLRKELDVIDKQFSDSISPLESVYRTFILQYIAKQENDDLRFEQHTDDLRYTAEKHQFVWLSAQLAIDDSVNYAKKGQVQLGLDTVLKAIELAQESNALYLLPKAYNTAGVLSNLSNQLIDAQRYFLLGISISKQLPPNLYTSKTYNNLGLLYLHIERWGKALEYIQKSKQLYYESGLFDENLMNVLLLNEAYIYNRLGDKESAKKTYLLSQQYYEEESADTRQQLMNLKGQAELELLLGETDKVLISSQTCINTPKSEKYPVEYGQCWLLQSKALFELKLFSQALESVEQTIAVFKKIDHSRWLIRAYQQKALTHESLGDLSVALETYKTFYTQEKQQLLGKVYDLEHAFATRQIEQERDLLNIQNQLTNVQLSKETLRFQVACITVIIATLALVFALKQTLSVHSKNIELENLSNIDQLTELHNRRYYLQQLKLCSHINRRTQYRIVLFDLDHFKSINDQHGHNVGDEVLVETAERLKQCVKPFELLIRWGGEEFLMLLKDESGLPDRVKSICHTISQNAFRTSAGELNITTSIGVSQSASPLNLRSNDEFFRNADKSLYEAKRSGRNRAIFSTDDDQS